MGENLLMVRGDTFQFSIEIEGLTSDLTSAYFSCKRQKDDTEYVFQKSLGDGITKTGSTDNSITYQITVDPEDTDGVEEGNYYYDLQIGVSNDIFTPFIGILKIKQDITTTIPVTPSA